MKGLLLKDLYMIRTYCKSIVLIVLIFAVAGVCDGSFFFSLFPAVVAGTIPITLISYDERSGWNVYSGAMPYSKAQLVSAKYLIMIFVMFLCAAVFGAAQAVSAIISRRTDFDMIIMLIGLIIAVGMISPCIMMPIVFRYGSEKGRIMYFIIVGIISGLLGIYFSKGEQALSFDFQGGSMTAAISAIAMTAVITAVSWLLSVRLYRIVKE